MWLIWSLAGRFPGVLRDLQTTWTLDDLLDWHIAQAFLAGGK